MAKYKTIEKTKRAIKNAFYDLIEEKGDIRNISVKELVDRADISKSTFYTHYKDIRSVLLEFENEAIEETITQIRAYYKDTVHIPDQYVHSLFELFKKNESMYSKLFKSNADFQFLDRMFDHTYNELYKFFSATYTIKNTKRLKYELSFLTYGTISMLFNYFVGRLDFSLDEIEIKTIEMLKVTNSHLETVGSN